MPNLLGRPKLSLFEVLAREATQNSWDARRNGCTVEFAARGRSLDSDAARTLQDLLRRGLEPGRLPELHAALGATSLTILEVADRGTSGLGGPTRADIQVEGGEPRDFVAFVRNVGEPRDKEFGAGTFGFGKTIFYLVSQPRTIIAYTRCSNSGELETRLIACALGESFSAERDGMKRPYTGRHWWGTPTGEVQEPLLGRDADEVAALLGIVPFAEDETGTSIVVLDPAFDDPVEDMRAIACALAWHAWPKLIADADAMHFTVDWNDVEIPIPDPEQTPPLDAFVAAYRRVQSGEPVECYRPIQRLGMLALHRRLVRATQVDYPASFDPPIKSPVHHVALLRAPHFIVKYLAGDPLAGDTAEYAGVFIADREIDDVFAAAEPPTHDDWIPQQLKGAQRTFVRTTYTRLSEKLRTYARPLTGAIVSAGGIPLGAASSQFAALVATAPSTGGAAIAGGGPRVGGGAGGGAGGAGGGAGGGTPGGGRRRSSAGSIEEIGEPEYGTLGDSPALLFAFRVRRAADDAMIHAAASVAVEDNTAETEAPVNAGAPRVLGWVGPDGRRHPGAALAAQGRIGQIWRVAIAPVPDTVTSVTLRIEAP